MEISLIPLALLFSAIMGGMEVAFAHEGRLRLQIESRTQGLYAFIIRELLVHQWRFFATIWLSRIFAVVLFVISMEEVVVAWAGVAGWIALSMAIFFVVHSLVYLLVPLVSDIFLKIFAYFYYLVYVLLYPLTWCFYPVRKSFSSQDELDKEDLISLVEDSLPVVEQEQGQQEIQVDENQKKLFQNALDFSELHVRDCMTPRVEVEAVSIDATIEQLRAVAISSHFSRIPIYEGTIDNVVGYARSRELFKDFTLVAQMVTKAIYAAETTPLQHLFREFIRTRRSMAIVIDEFGGTAGVITLEDILEEIFGEIEDEHDVESLAERDLGHGRYIFSGRQPVEHLNAEYGLDIPLSDDYETLAGYVLYCSEDMPKAGDTLIIGALELKIMRAKNNRIALVEVHKIEGDVGA
ncbi:MAG: hemolysin family protein [Mucinivorans sp.]